MRGTWVLVADGSRAKIFTTKRHNGQLREFKTLINPAGRLTEEKLVSDYKGRSFDSMGGGHVCGSGVGQ